jgi:hypothetical protein
MAAIAPIAVNDGQATPVTHTYNPVQTGDLATFKRNGDTAVPVVGFESVVLSLKEANGSSEAVNRAKVTLRIPVLETPTGGTPSGYVAPPRVAYFMMATLEFILPNRSTAGQRKDLRYLAGNLLTNSQVIALIDTLERPY